MSDDMFIRSKDEALDVMADIMELPERRDQIIQSTIGIMQCLDPEPREFMYDCQALLIEGGLEALRQKRRDLVHLLEENTPVAIVDPEEDRQFEEIATAFDALRLSDVVRQVFPELAKQYAPWEIARALIGREQEVQERIVAALRGRKSHDQAQFAADQKAVDDLILAQRPSWHAQAPRIRKACRDVLASAELVKPDELDGEAELISSLIAASGDGAGTFLGLMDREPRLAIEQVTKVHQLAETVKKLLRESGD